MTITGDAGVGKTRLATELVRARSAAADPAPGILLGRNPPYGRGIAFWALGEILRAAAGAGADDSVAQVHEALAPRLAELGRRRRRRARRTPSRRRSAARRPRGTSRTS